MTLGPGKLPASVLTELLSRVAHTDRRVLVGPGVGQDAAVIDAGDRCLVATSDPITFATERAGWYAVHVNANDVACMGAEPRWLLATLLLPEGAGIGVARTILDDIGAACTSLGVTLIGGHTEATPSVERPIVAATMIGEARRDELVIGENITAGDAVLLTQGVAIEGTALLARQEGDELRKAGVDTAVIESARGFLDRPGISVVQGARTIRAGTKPRRMHDPTEGGVASALWEMAYAADAVLRIDGGAIPVFPETEAICSALGLDPLGLLASGALLAIVDAGDAPGVIERLADDGIDCAVIGTVESGPAGVILGADDRALPFPSFARDELARYYDAANGDDAEYDTGEE